MSVLDFLDDELAALAGRDRLRVPRVVRGPQGTRIRLDGREVVSFSSNDYLGLAGDPAIRAAAMAEIDRSGVGAGASRLIVGNQEAHVELEQSLAALFRCESALLFNSGYAANTGLLAVLADGSDAIFSDQLNHASIIDGCRLSRASTQVYPHLDYGVLDGLLEQSSSRRKIVVTESVFSMDGDLADLVELRAIADRRGAILVVDEAHAVGVLGPTGGGLLEAMDVRADVVIGTLGKALGSAGACIAGSRSLTKVLWNRARPLVFSTGLPAMVAAAARAAVDLVRGPVGLQRRAQLQENTRLMRVPRGTAAGSVPRETVPRGTELDRRGPGEVPRGTDSGSGVPRETVPRGTELDRRRPGEVPRRTDSSSGVPRETVPRGTEVDRRGRGEVPRGTDLDSGVSGETVPRGTSDLGRRFGLAPIVPLVVGEDRAVMRWTDFLLANGLYVQGIRPPTVPDGTARLRIAMSASHDEGEIKRLVDALAEGERQGLQISAGLGR